MSRVVYTDIPDTPEQEGLRAAHQVRVVSAEEEGTGIKQLPNGVYGYTYSPALGSAPLFAKRVFRSYETHKLADGEIVVIGFADVEAAAALESEAGERTIQIHPEPEGNATVLVQLPYSRIRQNRQHAAPNQQGVTVTIAG